MYSAFGVDHGEVAKAFALPAPGSGVSRAAVKGRKIGQINAERTRTGQAPFDANSRPTLPGRRRKAWEKAYRGTGAPVTWTWGL